MRRKGPKWGGGGRKEEARRSVGVAIEVDIKESSTKIVNKTANSGFETERKHHPESSKDTRIRKLTRSVLA